MRSPSFARRRLIAIDKIQHQPGAAASTVFYAIAEALALAAIVAVWLFAWAATPADAAEVLREAAPLKGLSLIVLGAFLLGIAYLLTRAMRRGAQ